MRSSLLAVSLVLVAGAASAQDIPEAVHKEFWCGVAFDLAARDVPPDAAPEVLSVVTPYKEGAQLLIGRAQVAMLEAGYTEEAFAALRTDTEAEVLAQLARERPGIEPVYSFEDCAALIGQ